MFSSDNKEECRKHFIWANMSVTDWLNELLPDKEVIHKINEVLKGNN